MVNHLKDLKIDFELIVYNDGSKDNTLEKLNGIKVNHKELKIVDKENTGHGPTILKGYLEANSKWVFQMDSDNEIKVNDFDKLWSIRENYDFIVGKRSNRLSPLPRRIITFFSKMTIRLFYRSKICDSNCPFRLFRNDKFRVVFEKIPNDTFAPNVILSGMASYMNLNIKEVEVKFYPRETGEVSIKKLKLLKVAIMSWLQTIIFIVKYRF